jgi:transcriptional regulator with XRE-family HTH domain
MLLYECLWITGKGREMPRKVNKEVARDDAGPSGCHPRQRKSAPRHTGVRKRFAAALVQAREELSATLGFHISQADVAAALQMQKMRYHRYENGEAEPSLGSLVAMRYVLNISLDALIPDDPELLSQLKQFRSIAEGDPSAIGARLRCIREVFYGPHRQHMARRLNVKPAEWAAWETGHEEPPVHRMREFAHRFFVTLDFVYSGDMSGINGELREDLLRLYPALAKMHQTASAGEAYRAAKHQDAVGPSRSPEDLRSMDMDRPQDECGA